MSTIQELMNQFKQGDLKSLSKIISMVENDLEGSEEILQSLSFENGTPVIGITGPPGAGKSTLVNALLKYITIQGKKVGVLAVDPSSPFSYGALLGDRIRMSEHFSNENIFIRSLASRGSLGGLSEKVIEVTDVMRAFGFDYILIETVGVGQSEVEIVGLADTTIVVLIPEFGDEVQTMKAGLLEIADIFVVNKSDKANADGFVKNLQWLIHSKPATDWELPVLKTIATSGEGINELWEKILKHHRSHLFNEKKLFLLTQKVLRLIQTRRMKNIDTEKIIVEIEEGIENGNLNIYSLVKKYG